jgi:phage replication initiation protein
MDERIFTETLDWLAFTVPRATVDEMGPVIGGEWFETTTGFRGYPTCWLTNQGHHGVGKLGTNAHRDPKEVHVNLSAGIVST